MYFVIANSTSNAILKTQLAFTLKNLQTEDGKDKYDITVMPKQNYIVKMKPIENSGVSYSYSEKFMVVPQNEQ